MRASPTLMRAAVERLQVRPAALVEASQGAAAGEHVAVESATALRRAGTAGGAGTAAVAAAFGQACSAFASELIELAADARRLAADVEQAAAEYVRTESRVLARAGGP